LPLFRRQGQRIVAAKQEAIEVDRKLQESQRIHAIDIPFTQCVQGRIKHFHFAI
jgi:hypothetical protein